MQRMRSNWPDVIVLDVEMPRMDGITSSEDHVGAAHPVVICSTLTVAGAETTMQALAAGAVTIVTKPKIGVRNFLLDASADLVEAVKIAARAKSAQSSARRRAWTRRARRSSGGGAQGHQRARRRPRHVHGRHSGARVRPGRAPPQLARHRRGAATCRKSSLRRSRSA